MPNSVKRRLRLYSRLQWLERMEKQRATPDLRRTLKLQRLQARLVRRIALDCLVA
jgi:hypothetical protein